MRSFLVRKARRCRWFHPASRSGSLRKSVPCRYRGSCRRTPRHGASKKSFPQVLCTRGVDSRFSALRSSSDNLRNFVEVIQEIEQGKHDVGANDIEERLDDGLARGLRDLTDVARDVHGLVAGIRRNDAAEYDRLDDDEDKVRERKCLQDFRGEVVPGKLQVQYVSGNGDKALDDEIACINIGRESLELTKTVLGDSEKKAGAATDA